MTESANEDAPQKVETPTTPSLGETLVHFFQEDLESYRFLSQRLFAIITQWVEFEDVQGADRSLKFPGGNFVWQRAQGKVVLSLSPGLIPLHQILAELDKNYSAIQFRTSHLFDFGDLVRRSRDGVRNITLISPAGDSVTLRVGTVDLEVEKLEQAGSITVSSQSNAFRPTRAPLPYTTVIQYLLEDPPPTEALIAAARLALGFSP